MKPASPEQAVFAEALQRSAPEARTAYLEAACGTDAALRRRVEALLRAAGNAGDFLEEPPTGLSGDADSTLLVTGHISGKPGQRCGDYELIEEIARGGMGIVFKARQRKLDRIVAVKVILSGEFASKEQALRFRVEAEAAARLQHPNIVRIHETGEQDGQPYFSMDYVEGGNLAALVHEKPLSAKRAASYVKTIAEAIHYAHEQGILHRDLKPSNVLIDHGDQPHVTDFGLAKRMTKESLLTATGDMMGSPNFMPPEQAGAKGVKAGRYSDVYGMGAILFYLVTGRPPFVTESIAETLHHVLNTEPVSPRLLNPSVPQDIATICLKCLEKEPAKRYQTAQQLADELKRFLNDEPIHARPNSRTEKLWRWSRRKPALAGFIAATGLLLLSVAVISTLSAVRIAAAHDESRDRLFRLQVHQGKQLAEQGDASGALLWFAETLKLHAGKPERERIDRLRLGLTLAQCPKPERIFFHEGWSDPGDFNSDFTRMVSLTKTGSVELLDLRSGKATVFRVPLQRFDRVQFGPQTDHFATQRGSGAGAMVELWGLASTITPASELFSTRGHRMNFSPDGTRAVVTLIDHTAQVFDLTTGASIGVPIQHSDKIVTTSFSPDGRRKVTGADDKTARVWDAATGFPISPPIRHDDHVRQAVFSPDGRHVLTVCDVYTRSPVGTAGEARIWNTTNGEPVSPPLRHTVRLGFKGKVLEGCFSPNGQYVATAGEDRTVRLWEASTGQAVGLPLPHDDWPRQIVFSPNSRYLATVSHTTLARHIGVEARLWSVATGLPVSSPLRQSGTALKIRFSLDGRFLWTTSQTETRMWNLASVAETALTLKSSGEILQLSISQDGKCVAAANNAGTAQIWNAETGVAMTPALQHKDWVYAVAFSPDGRLLATGCRDGAACVWDVNSGGLLSEMKHDSAVTHVEFSRDGRSVVTGSGLAYLRGGNGAAQVWDAVTGRALTPPLMKASGSPHGAVKAVFSPDGGRIVAARDPAVWNSNRVIEAQVWDVKGSRTIGQPMNHHGPIRHVAWSSDGKRVATASYDGTARVWSAATGRAVTPPLKHGEGVNWISFRSDGERVITASGDRTARVWDASSGRAVGPPMVHETSVASAAFSPDGQLILTISGFKACLWNAATGDQITSAFRHPGQIRDGSFSSDGRRVVTAGDDKTIRIWNLPFEQRPIEDLMLLAHLSSNLQFDANGGLVPLDSNESTTFIDWVSQLLHLHFPHFTTTKQTAVSAAWDVLRSKYPEEFGESPTNSF